LAEKDDKFVGLVIDEHQQADKTDERIAKWVEMLKKEMK
jgi:flavodoxin I